MRNTGQDPASADESTGCAGLGGGRVASAAGGTGVDSPEAGETAAAVGAQPASGRMPTTRSAPIAVRQPGLRWSRIASVDIGAELTSWAVCWRLTVRHVDGCRHK